LKKIPSPLSINVLRKEENWKCTRQVTFKNNLPIKLQSVDLFTETESRPVFIWWMNRRTAYTFVISIYIEKQKDERGHFKTKNLHFQTI